MTTLVARPPEADSCHLCGREMPTSRETPTPAPPVCPSCKLMEEALKGLLI